VNNAAHRLVDAAVRLWPDHAVAVGGTAGGAHELVFLPNAGAPRVLVPARHPVAAARALRRFSHVLTVRQRASRLAVGAALRAGGERLFPDRVVIRPGTGRSDSIESHLSELLGTDVVVSITVGSTRANQKPVLGVFDRRGYGVAFVKVGDTPGTVESVRREAKALAAVGARAPAALEVPRLLHCGPWRGLELLVMSTLDTVAWPTRRPVRRPPVDAMEALADCFDGGTRPLAETGFWQGLLDAGTTVTGGCEHYADALATIEARYGERPVRLGAWHGDWTPWNMAWRGDRVQLWDWEQFATGAPRGLDRVHYVLNTVARRDGFSRDSVAAALRSPEVRAYRDPDEQRLLVALYLAAITARYLHGSQGEGGDVLRGTSAVVLDALTAAAGHTGGVR
jgi:hypothetical protein